MPGEPEAISPNDAYFLGKTEAGKRIREDLQSS